MSCSTHQYVLKLLDCSVCRRKRRI